MAPALGRAIDVVHVDRQVAGAVPVIAVCQHPPGTRPRDHAAFLEYDRDVVEPPTALLAAAPAVPSVPKPAEAEPRNVRPGVAVCLQRIGSGHEDNIVLVLPSVPEDVHALRLGDPVLRDQFTRMDRLHVQRVVNKSSNCLCGAQPVDQPSEGLGLAFLYAFQLVPHPQHGRLMLLRNCWKAQADESNTVRAAAAAEVAVGNQAVQPGRPAGVQGTCRNVARREVCDVRVRRRRLTEHVVVRGPVAHRGVGGMRIAFALRLEPAVAHQYPVTAVHLRHHHVEGIDLVAVHARSLMILQRQVVENLKALVLLHVLL